jgi:hypothetical protein
LTACLGGATQALLPFQESSQLHWPVGGEDVEALVQPAKVEAVSLGLGLLVELAQGAEQVGDAEGVVVSIDLGIAEGGPGKGHHVSVRDAEGAQLLPVVIATDADREGQGGIEGVEGGGIGRIVGNDDGVGLGVGALDTARVKRTLCLPQVRASSRRGMP